MLEEASERARLVEEQEARRKEEEKDERARMRFEKERIRKEKEEERLRKEEELKKQLEEDRRRSRIFTEELESFRAHLEDQKQIRLEKEALWNRPKEDFADAAEKLEAVALRLIAIELLKPYAAELKLFAKNLEVRKKLRSKMEDEYCQEIAEREKLRRERLMKKTAEK